MASKIQDLLKTASKGFPKPVYVLHGEEDFFTDRVLKLMETTIVPDSEAAFNKIIVYGKDSSVEAVASAARQFPFIGGRMLILVKDAQLMPGIEGEKTPQLFEALFASMPPTTCLVLGFRGKKLDARKSLYKFLEKKEMLYESEKLKDNQLPDYVKSTLSSLGYKIDEKAAQVMADVVGNDLSRMENELSKLMLRFGKEKPIGIDEIYSTIGISKDYNIFELQSAFCGKNLTRMLAILANFQSNTKEHPIVKEGLVFSSFLVKLSQYKHLTMDASGPDVAKQMKLNYYQIKDFEQAARHYGIRQIDRVLELFLNADRQIKGLGATAMDEEEVYRELQIGLLSVLSPQD